MAVRDPLSLGTTISAVWLTIYRAQRPLRYNEITQELSEMSHAQRGPALHAAFRLGYLQRTGAPRAYEYAVTPNCTVPPGVRVLDVLEPAA
jgi:hypothetical protein